MKFEIPQIRNIEIPGILFQVDFQHKWNRPFTIYLLTVVLSNGHQYRIGKRYSEFVEFDNKIKQINSSFGSEESDTHKLKIGIVGASSGRLFPAMSKIVVEQRRKWLETYLNEFIYLIYNQHKSLSKHHMKSSIKDSLIYALNTFMELNKNTSEIDNKIALIERTLYSKSEIADTQYTHNSTNSTSRPSRPSSRYYDAGGEEKDEVHRDLSDSITINQRINENHKKEITLQDLKRRSKRSSKLGWHNSQVKLRKLTGCSVVERFEFEIDQILNGASNMHAIGIRNFIHKFKSKEVSSLCKSKHKTISENVNHTNTRCNDYLGGGEGGDNNNNNYNNNNNTDQELASIHEFVTALVGSVIDVHGDKLVKLSTVALSDRQLLDVIRASVEKSVVSPIYPIILSYIMQQTSERDLMISTKLAFIQGESSITSMTSYHNLQRQFGIGDEFNSKTNYETCIRLINQIGQSVLPSSKLYLIIQCFQELHKEAMFTQQAYNKNTNNNSCDDLNMIGADDLLPIFTYILCLSHLHLPQTTCVFLWKLTPSFKLEAEIEYYLTVFESALYFIVHLDVSGYQELNTSSSNRNNNNIDVNVNNNNNNNNNNQLKKELIIDPEYYEVSIPSYRIEKSTIFHRSVIIYQIRIKLRESNEIFTTEKRFKDFIQFHENLTSLLHNTKINKNITTITVNNDDYTATINENETRHIAASNQNGHTATTDTIVTNHDIITRSSSISNLPPVLLGKRFRFMHNHTKPKFIEKRRKDLIEYMYAILSNLSLSTLTITKEFFFQRHEKEHCQ